MADFVGDTDGTAAPITIGSPVTGALETLGGAASRLDSLSGRDSPYVHFDDGQFAHPLDYLLVETALPGGRMQ